AAKVAERQPDKGARQAGKRGFTLNRMEDLGDAHEPGKPSAVSKEFFARRRGTLEPEIDCRLTAMMGLMLVSCVENRYHMPIHYLDSHSLIDFGVIEPLDGADHKVIAFVHNPGQCGFRGIVFRNLFEVREIIGRLLAGYPRRKIEVCGCQMQHLLRERADF